MTSNEDSGGTDGRWSLTTRRKKSMTMLSKKALEGIASYKYKAGSYTFIDNKLNVFWTAAVELLPTWMAPNLVTMVGTCAMLFTTIVQLFVSPHLSEPAPFWVYLLSAVGLFFYQTMDALDGKQARRTGASSPLGQLFDHGCDAFCTIINVLSAAATVQLGSEVLTYVAISSVSITFYMAQWEEYHTGVMSCGNGWYGVTEGQLTLVAVHLLTAVVGPAFWTIVLPVPFVSITPAHVLVMALIGSNIILVSGNVLNVIRTPLEAMSAEEAGAKHRAKPVAMFQLVPISILVVLGYFWVSGPNVADYKAYPLLFLFPYGIAFVFFSTRMIVSHMCKVPFTPQLRVLIPFGLLILNTYGPTLGLFPKPLLRPLLATVLYGLGITCIYLHYVVHVVYDISCYLNIYVFKIKMKQ